MFVITYSDHPHNSLKRIATKHINDFGDYVEKCYEPLEQQLSDICPIAQTLATTGCLGQRKLEIQSFGAEEELSRIRDHSLNRWIKYVDEPKPAHETYEFTASLQGSQSMFDHMDVHTIPFDPRLTEVDAVHHAESRHIKTHNGTNGTN